MSSSIKRAISLHVILVLSHWVLFNVRAEEPTYKEKPLSEWICCALPDDQEEAFTHLGTNSLPIVLDIIGATDKRMKSVAKGLESSEFKEKANSGDDGVINQLRESASKAFEILGTNAVSAVPRLVKILNENDEVTSVYAADALGQIGHNGFIALTNLLTSNKSNTRSAVVDEIARGNFDSKVVTPILISLLNDKFPDVRQSAANGLSGRNPKDIIPLLISVLDDPNIDVKVAAASALGSYGEKATSAIQKITFAYTNSISAGLPVETCKAFSDALRAIDLEEAKKTEALVFTNPLNPYRRYYTRTKLASGLELIAGGYIQTDLFPTNHYLASAELYNPKTRTWNETGQMTTPRYGHAAALLSNGKVLVAAGGDNIGVLSSAELYDPQSGIWTKTPPMKKPNGGGQLILQPDGKVLFVNGIDYPRRLPFDKELYDPVADTWAEITIK